MTSQLLLILCTLPNQESATNIASNLVEQRLAACVNLIPAVSSIYLWKGKLEQAQEVQMVVKTTKSQYKDVERAICRQHPYELPEIIAVPVEQGLTNYLEWVEQCTIKT